LSRLSPSTMLNSIQTLNLGILVRVQVSQPNFFTLMMQNSPS